MEINQKSNQISGNVSTFPGIPRSVNNPGSKVKSEGNNQSILEGPIVFEGEYICYFARTNGSARIDLAVFSISIFSNSFILSRL